MNELIKLNNSKLKLSIKQEILYNFICEKLEQDEPITFEEAKEMYIKHSCRQVINGIPHEGRNYYKDGEYKWKLVPMQEEWLKMSVVMYLTRGIGSLVLKGALKITPQLNFS